MMLLDIDQNSVVPSVSLRSLPLLLFAVMSACGTPEPSIPSNSSRAAPAETATVNLLAEDVPSVVKESAPPSSIPSTSSVPKAKPFAIVELFTSQGCNSCPPADAVLAELVKRHEDENVPIYALSFHVDYWDRLGWKDPFSSVRFTQRQRGYATVFRTKSIYTPQMIVNGTQQFVGSRRKDAARIVDAALEIPPTNQVVVVVRPNAAGKTWKVTYQLGELPKDSVLNFALVERTAKTRVLRGENSGRTLSHANIVRRFLQVRPEKLTGELDIEIPTSLAAQSCRLIVYLQRRDTGTIVAATEYTPPAPQP